MNNYTLIQTSRLVWLIIRESHPELKVFSSCTEMDNGYIMTEFGFMCSHIPLIRIEIRWTIEYGKRVKDSEEYKYFLCIPTDKE